MSQEPEAEQAPDEPQVDDELSEEELAKLPPYRRRQILAERATAGADGPTLPPDEVLPVQVRVWAELGRTRLPLERVLNLQPGQVIELEQEPQQPLDVFVNGHLYARGQLVVVDGDYAISIEQVDPPDPQLFGVL